MEFSIENMFKLFGCLLAPVIIWLLLLYIIDIIDIVKCNNCNKKFKTKYKPPNSNGEVPTHICRPCRRKLKREK